MANDFVRFDAIEDVLSSLDLLALTSPLVKKQPSYWKWVIIAAHSSLQGAMVCALCDSAGVSILRKDSAREVLEWLDKPPGEPEPDVPPQKKKYPIERLADFDTLIRRCREAGRLEGHPLKLSEAQVQDVKYLHREFRNQFAHFIPNGWSIARADLPRITRAAMDVTEMLMANPRPARKLSGNQKRRIADRLTAARTHL